MLDQSNGSRFLAYVCQQYTFSGKSARQLNPKFLMSIQGCYSIIQRKIASSKGFSHLALFSVGCMLVSFVYSEPAVQFILWLIKSMTWNCFAARMRQAKLRLLQLQKSQIKYRNLSKNKQTKNLLYNILYLTLEFQALPSIKQYQKSQSWLAWFLVLNGFFLYAFV